MDKQTLRIGLIGGLLASLCCVGPAILFLLGIVTAGAAFAMTEFTQYFVVIALAFVAAGLYLRFTAKSCTLASKEKAGYTFAVIATVVIIYAFLLYVAMPAIFEANSASPKPVSVEAPPSLVSEPEAKEELIGVERYTPNDTSADPQDNNTHYPAPDVNPAPVPVPEPVPEPEPEPVPEPEPEPVFEPEPERPPKGNQLQRISVSIAQSECNLCTYIIEDTWQRHPGVVIAEVGGDREGYVIFAEWAVSADEILDSIKPRFSARVNSVDYCSYDLNFKTYCCGGDCKYLSDLPKRIP